MGIHGVGLSDDPEAIRRFTRAVLDDLRALEALLARKHLEHGVARMGVEQELFLVDGAGRPAPVAEKVLARLSDSRFTTELARYNLEANLAPKPLCGEFLRELEHELNGVIDQVRAAGHPRAMPILVGCLPTLRRSDLSLALMTPAPRYKRLNEALCELRGGGFPINIHGIDSLQITHDSVMLESANTSVQLHLQVDPPHFARAYNIAQLISAPLLACSVNSPILLGRRLWHETRVALFEQAVDGRSPSELDRGQATRVCFGQSWVKDSALELFRESASRFSAIFGPEVEGTSLDGLDEAPAPPLKALNLHNGTVWRWNRACYGTLHDRGHLRIENRVLPSGPTVLDEVANAAFFYGLMLELPEAFGDVSRDLEFHHVRANFQRAARHGLDAHFMWLGHRKITARDLILGELIQHARHGLRAAEVPEPHIERYLGVIERRTESGQTGARWILDSLDRLAEDDPSMDSRLQKITAAMLDNQLDGRPVHRWNVVEPGDITMSIPASPSPTVAEIMSKDLFTVDPDEVLDLPLSVMQWQHIRHVPVEDREGRIVGLVNHHALLAAHERQRAGAAPAPVREIMMVDPPTVSPDTDLVTAMRRVLETRFHCLLVTMNDRLVGIVTERDFLRASASLLER